MAEVHEFVKNVERIVADCDEPEVFVRLSDVELLFRHDDNISQISFSSGNYFPSPGIIIGVERQSESELYRKVRFTCPGRYDEAAPHRWPHPTETRSILVNPVDIIHAINIAAQPLSSRASREALSVLTEADIAAAREWQLELNKINRAEASRLRTADEALDYAARRFGNNRKRNFTSKAR